MRSHISVSLTVQQGGHANEGDPSAIIFNPIASTVPKMAEVQTSEVGAKLAPVSIGE
jgi:hypothetical protein